MFHRIFKEKYTLIKVIFLLTPLSLIIGGAEIFFMSIAFILFNLVKILKQDKFQLKYLNSKIVIFAFFIFLTFIINFIINFDPLYNLRRILSVTVYFFFFLVFYTSSRMFLTEEKYIQYIDVTIFANLSFNFYALFYLINQSDLMIARDFLGQRIPALISIFVIISLYLSIHIKKNRYLYFLNFVFGLGVVILSLTRAAYLQVMFGIIIIIISSISIKKLFNLFLIILIGFILFIVFDQITLSYDYSQIAERMSRLFNISEQANETSGGFRLHYWSKLLNILFENPIHLFIGYGGLGADFVGGESSAHSEYMDHLVRYGLIGLSIYVLILLMFVKKLLNFKSEHILIEKYFKGFGISLITIMIYGLFHESTKYQLLGILIWFNL